MEYQIGQANRLGNRASNQDRFTALEGEQSLLLVLADGMGGHSGGELAAQTLIDVATEAFSLQAQPIRDPATFFSDIIERTHYAIHELAMEQQLRSPPGTTGVLCLLQGGTAQWAHVGDSRLYVFRDELPLYRTRDHSYVEKLARRGAIRFADKSSHPMRNQITQCIGCQQDLPRIDIAKPVTLAEGDVILMCSDGLWGGLDDVQIAAMLRDPDLDAAANLMAEEAERNSYPYSDNISVLTLRVISGEERPAAARQVQVKPLLAPREPGPERLQDAIEQIEQIIKKYEKEMNG